jgi:hypothetical protein
MTTTAPAMAAPDPTKGPAAPGIRTLKDAAFWRGQIDKAVRKRQRYEPWWEACMKAYAPFTASDAKAEDYGTDVRTNRTFTLVERKKADLFYQRPDVTLQPSPWMDSPIPGVNAPAPPVQPGQPAPPPQPIPQTVALQAHQEIVNEKLGENGIDAAEMMDAVTFDIICTQAVGFTKMGYESYTRDVPDPRDPTEQTTVPVPVVERCYWDHFSGKQAIIPAEFRSTEWDKAPFLGMAFTLPLTPANREKYKLPPNFTGGKAKGQPQYYDHGEGNADQGDQVFTGVELEYRSILFREDIIHPDHLTQLVLVDGIDEPVIERDSPLQTLLPDGTLSPDSVIGFTIHPFSIRKLTDSAYVASDGTMIRPLENELDVFRMQMVQFRDAQVLRYITNLPAEVIAKITRSPIGGIITVPDEAFHGDGAIKALEGGSMPRESFQSNDYIDNDLARTTGVDASGAGVQSDRSSTATEQQIVASNANARMDKERGTILKHYIKGVTKFSTLLQRYLPVADAVAILGPQRAQYWDAWRKTANSALAFTAMPDSALRVDQAVDRADALKFYSFAANDPWFAKGRGKLAEKLCRKHHIDPAGIVMPPDPPEPEKPTVSLSIASASLNPLMPEYANVYQVLTQSGYKNLAQPSVDPQTAMQIQAATKVAAHSDLKHGGMLAPQESLSKHQADQTGGMQGIGGNPAAMGAPGGHLQ